jgi:hypothetical protein
MSDEPAASSFRMDNEDSIKPICWYLSTRLQGTPWELQISYGRNKSADTKLSKLRHHPVWSWTFHVGHGYRSGHFMVSETCLYKRDKFGCRLLSFLSSLMTVFKMQKANEVKRLLLDGEWARIWNRAIIAYFKILYPGICLQRGENYGEPRSGQWVSYQKSALGT